MKTCTIDGCDLKNCAKGYCKSHYYRHRKYGNANRILRIIGNYSSKLYTTYTSMKARCYNKNNVNYKHYGGRGIEICDRRLGVNGFTNFLSDMGPRPVGYTLDRINNDGKYEPNNCKWSNRHTQTSNRRSNNKNVGVCRNKIVNKRRARININRKTIELGYYINYEDAVKARKEGELLYIK